MNAFAAIGPGELAVRVPGVRHRTADGDHLLQRFDLAVHGLAVGRDQAGRGRVQRGEEFVAVTCEQIHRVGAEKLVVADGGRDRLRVPVRGEPRLRVVFAVAAGLEGVDANRLLAGEAGLRRYLGVGLLEFRLGFRPVGHEVVLPLRRGEELGDCRKRRRRPLETGARHVTRRARRPAVDRRLLQHVVAEDDRLAVPAFGDAHAALFGDRLPVHLGLVVKGDAGLDIGFDRVDCRGRIAGFRGCIAGIRGCIVGIRGCIAGVRGRIVGFVLRGRQRRGAEQHGGQQPDRKSSPETLMHRQRRHLSLSQIPTRFA